MNIHVYLYSFIHVFLHLLIYWYMQFNYLKISFWLYTFLYHASKYLLEIMNLLEISIYSL